MSTHSPQDAATPALRVLVIDDDDIAREVMVDLLRKDGHEVSGLPSPIGATKHILDNLVHVVVLDVMMPSMRGDKLAALLSKNPKLKHLGVILVTGASGAQLNSLATEVNAAAVVEKSLVHERLCPAVRRAAKGRTHGSSSGPARA